MKTDREYPATHSSLAAWYAVDDGGELAIFQGDEESMKPSSRNYNPYAYNAEEGYKEDLKKLFFDVLLSAKFTSEQIDGMFANGVTPQELAALESEPSGLALVEMTFEGVQKIPRPKTSGFQLLTCSPPRYLYFHDNSEIKPFKKGFNRNEHACLAKYIKLFPEFFRRVVFMDKALLYDCEAKETRGYMRRCDMPLYLYESPGWDDSLCQVTLGYPSIAPCLNKGQVPKEIQAKTNPIAVKLRQHPRINLNLCLDYEGDLIWLETINGIEAMILEGDDGEMQFYSLDDKRLLMSVEEAFRRGLFMQGKKMFRINGRSAWFYDEEVEWYQRVGTRDTLNEREIETIEEVKTDKVP